MGVWYTPSEIVKYQVRHVDAVLEEKLEISGGLANDRVKILDPCCGTGAYLMETLNVIEERFRKRDEDGLAPAEMKKAAMSRIYGFEILTAPFVVSHLQLGLKLAESGAPLEAKDESDDSSKAERVGVYLTNALTGWKPPDNPQEILFPRLEKEREEAEAIKQEEEILVILGNPPYDGYADIATKDEERALSDAYRESPEDIPDPKGQGLNNPYVRFFRMAERQITEHTGQGIVCYISNYRWLDGSSHSGMRARYLEEFDQVWIDNLHGDRKASERNPEGLSSQTIFAREGQSPGIENGVAISLLCRRSGSEKRCAVRYRDFHQADAEERRKALLESLSEKNREQQYTKHDPSPELGLPLDPNQIAGDYLNWPSLPDLFLKAYPGIQTCRSSVVVDIDKEDLLDRMKAYFNPEVSHEEMKEIKSEAMESSDDDFDPEKTREALIERGFSPENIVRYCYRPMDIRWLYWEPQTDLLDREREDLVSNIFEDNVCLSAATSHRRGYDPPLTTHEYGSRHIIERGAHLFPLYLTQGGGGAKLETTERGLFDKVVPNLTERASSYLSGLGLGAETLFYHTIATLHSPRYQREHEDALENDWPRVPLPEDSNLLRRSAELGREITALLNTERSLDGVDSSGKIRDELHLLGRLERVGTDKPVNPNVDLAVTAGWGYTIPPSTVVPNKGEIERRSYTPDEEAGLPWQGHEQWGGETLDIYLNDSTRWTNVPKRVWNYTLGGYPVIKKWLSYREKDVLGRDLNYDEAQHVTSMVRRIAALLLLEPSLDDSYEDVKKVA
jgi:predicted helicase